MIINPKDQKKPLSHYFLKGETLKRFYGTAATAAGLLNSFFIIKSLSIFQFGLYQLLLSFVAILQSVNIFQFIDSVVGVDIRRYFNTEQPDRAKRLFGELVIFKVGFAALMTVAVFFGSEIIAHWYDQDIALFVKIVSALILIRALEGVTATFLKSVISFSYQSVPAVREAAKLILIIAAIFWYQFTIVEVIAIHVIGEAAAFTVLFFSAFIKRYRAAFSSVKIYSQGIIGPLMKTYGKWAMLRYAFSRVTKNTMPWFVKVFINTEAVAFYSLAVNLVAFMEGLMPLDGLAPIVALKADRRDELSYIFKQSAKYAVWLGISFLIIGVVAVPPLVVWVFPQYAPAIPIFRVMLFALPLFGVYKILKMLLSVLREHRVLAMRFINEVLVIPVGSVIFLPIFGVVGSGLVYAATYLERTVFFYSELIKKYPEFRFKAKNLFVFGHKDKEFLLNFWRIGKKLFIGK